MVAQEQLARHQRPVHPPGQAALLGELAGPDPGHGHEAQGQPVAHQQAHQPSGLALHTGEQHDQGGAG